MGEKLIKHLALIKGSGLGVDANFSEVPLAVNVTLLNLHYAISLIQGSVIPAEKHISLHRKRNQNSKRQMLYKS